MLTYLDGTKEYVFSKGGRKYEFPDGYIVFNYLGGDIRQIFPSGEYIYYYKEKDITQHYVKELVNYNMYVLPNGQIEKRFEDGKVHIQFPNKTEKIIYEIGDEASNIIKTEEFTLDSDGTFEAKNQENVFLQDLGDGSFKIILPSGEQRNYKRGLRVR